MIRPYPIICEPIIKTLVWGTEAWTLTVRDGDMCAAANGEAAGRPFDDIFNEDRESWLGETVAALSAFPLLVKVIDAKTDLSVQVHPGDDYAKRVEGDPYGKSEMWYILEAAEGARIVLGLADGTDREGFENALKTGSGVEKTLNYIPVKRGDLIDIPAGLLHAIGGGIKLAEIQQNSDRTYRVYDYGRLGVDGKTRELHVKKALDVTDFDGILPKRVCESGTIFHERFTVNKVDIDDQMEVVTDGGGFTLVTCVGGAVTLTGDFAAVTLKEGATVFVPAVIDFFVLEGDGECLLTFAEGDSL